VYPDRLSVYMKLFTDPRHCKTISSAEVEVVQQKYSVFIKHPISSQRHDGKVNFQEKALKDRILIRLTLI